MRHVAQDTGKDGGFHGVTERKCAQSEKFLQSGVLGAIPLAGPRLRRGKSGHRYKAPKTSKSSVKQASMRSLMDDSRTQPYGRSPSA